ncbi:MAG: PH domain-containing protein [Propionibacterium sp.]|uniref:YdbS-like PH domain-containing protein n=1 Tax=Brooklawnia propionicigenes TaxID=3041175 RepID=A0AAN0KAZ2_9ACTN|nr:PH domain-containing protein [Brooklawnia sp. SH051]NLI84225.1 PH domain-containing protein [Propionibacterium sp.]BEH03022.1 hypothetical protein brsh051_23030 [Brooklawnia sp. SH051]
MALELYPGEELVTKIRPHARTLLWPVIGLFAISALVGTGIAVVPRDYRPIGQQLVAASGALLGVVVLVRPLLRWATSSITLTTQRIIVRNGIVRHVEHQIPLNRIVDVATSRAAADLGFGSGTLLLTTVGGQQLRLAHLPQIKAMRQAVSELATEAQPELWTGPDPWTQTRVLEGPDQWH